ncbi:hypothetical protein TCAP_05788, partial [Tolypocladium capitatum]
RAEGHGGRRRRSPRRRLARRLPAFRHRRLAGHSHRRRHRMGQLRVPLVPLRRPNRRRRGRRAGRDRRELAPPAPHLETALGPRAARAAGRGAAAYYPDLEDQGVSVQVGSQGCDERAYWAHLYNHKSCVCASAAPKEHVPTCLGHIEETES